jgi:hypothetical protein
MVDQLTLEQTEQLYEELMRQYRQEQAQMNQHKTQPPQSQVSPANPPTGEAKQKKLAGHSASRILRRLSISGNTSK